MTDPTTRRDHTGTYPPEDAATTRYDTDATREDRAGFFGETERPATEERHHDALADREHDRRHHDGTYAEHERHERFGGLNLGGAFFGWLVAVALTILLAGIVGAVAAAVGETLNLTQSDAEGEAEALGLAAGITLLVVLMIGYYTGGYVSGRMSRFDGARQGFGVWLIGIVVALLVALTGWIFGNQYDVFDRVDLPSVSLDGDTLTTGGLVLAAAVLLGTLLAAVVGGKAGLRYHHKVDRFPT